MADPRTFTLIGEFKDGITPELEKINKQLAALKTNFSGIGSRKNTGFRGATQEIGKLVSAHKKLSESIKDVQGDLRSTVGVLQQYRKEMGKAAAATRAFQKSGGSLGSRQFAQNMDAANRSAQAYLRTLQQINAQSRRMPRGGMGGGFQPPRPPRGGGGYGGMYGGGAGGMTPSSRRGGGGMGAHMAEFGFAYTLGNAIAQPIQNAVVAGFQIGVGLMTKPFEYFANAFGERVQDQLSDLKAAGGLFSISKRSQTPFLATIDEAIQYQQDTNRVFAKMAASLPGVTNDYVQVGKRLSDTMGRIAAGDFQNALQEANRIRATEEGRKFYGKEITGTGPAATREVITTLLGEMTKKTTIAGMGGRSGAGGIAGAYGLPGLTERMLSQQEVSMGQFQRYAAVFSDPTIQDALSRNVDLINKTLPNTTARFKAMQKLLNEVVTEDLIEKLRTSVDGIYQGLRSAILDPDTGLFGLGRQFENFGYKINQYGQYVVDKEGKKIKDSLSIFEIVADIFSNAGQAILPLVEALPLVFDPLKKVASILMDARHYAAEFNRTFNMYREGLKKLSETPGKDFLKDTLDVRASLSAVSNLLYQFGAIGKGEFESIGKQLLSKDLDIGGMLKSLLDSVLNSQIASEIGATIGEIIGVVISEVAGVTGFISGRIAKSNKLFEGIKSGFEKAGGPAALSNIFKDIFDSMLKALFSIGKLIPLQGYLIAGAALVMPAIAQGLGMKIGEEALKLITKFGVLFDKGTAPTMQKMKDIIKLFFTRLLDSFRNMASRDLAIQRVTVRDLGANPPKALPPAGMPKALPPAGALATPAVARGMSAFAKFMGYFKGVGPRFMGFFKGFLGKLTILGGVITSVVSLFQGKDLATALAEGAGPVLGAALGAALIPFLGPIGPMIGSAIGGWIGSLKSVTEPLADGIRAVFGTFQTTFDFLVQIGRDLLGLINGLVRIIPGVGQGFDFLRAVIFALLSPFKLLEIAINGLYDLYLWIKSKTVGVSTEERARMNERRTVRATDEFTIMGREGAGYSLAQQKAAEYAKFQEAKAKGDTKAMNRIAEYMKSIDRMIAQRGGKAGAPAKTAAATPTTVTTGTVPGQTPAISPSLPQQLTAAWQGVETWFNNLPYNLGVAVGRLKVGMENAFVNFFNWLSGLSTRFGEWVNSTVIALRAKWNSFMNQAAADFKSGAIWSKLGNAILTGFKNMITGIIPKIIAMANPAMWGPMISQWAQGAAGKFMQGLRAGEVQARSAAPAPKPAGGTAVSPIFSRAKGGLGDAIASEMRMKPPGSDLVIANSSETVIPAAGGYGMQEFMNILSTGFSIVNQQYKSLASGVNLLTQETNTKFQQAETTNADRYQKTTTAINNNHQQNQTEFGKINQNILQLSQKVATMSSMGGMMGAGGMALGGGYGSAGMQIAGQLGNFIKQTGGAPGSIHEHPMHGGVKGKHAPGSYHYSGRAIDIGAYANEQAGVIARIQQFNAKMGVKPVEFLHAGNDPRGHSDHVHVAYALGQGRPAFFNSQRAAENWEASMAGRMNVRSVTGNTLEGFGGSNVGDIYVTVNAGATNDPDQLAYMVAERIQTAVSDAVNSNILV